MTNDYAVPNKDVNAVNYGDNAHTASINWLLENTILKEYMQLEMPTEESRSLINKLLTVHFGGTLVPHIDSGNLFSIKFNNEQDFAMFMLRFG